MDSMISPHIPSFLMVLHDAGLPGADIMLPNSYGTQAASENAPIDDSESEVEGN
jgi:hypothetical protein